jgi:purine-binding chemotaxis protein CheW
MLTFRLGGQVYGLPVTEVAQIIEMVTLTHLPQAPFAVQGLINLRGKIVPVIDLRLRFGLPLKSYQLHTPIILTSLNGQKLGLIVDWVEEVVEISQADLETSETIIPSILASSQPGPGLLTCLAGVAKVERRLILLLKNEVILSQNEQAHLVEQVAMNQSQLSRDPIERIS